MKREPNKKKRIIRSFVPAPDVQQGLKNAVLAGVKISHVANEGCRQWLSEKGFLKN